MGNHQTLCILHTNDIHSFFEQMPKISSAIQYYRSQAHSTNTLVIDCGDHMDRMRVHTEGSSGMANIEIMNATGYEYAVPGNNEGLTFTIPELQEAYGQMANFSVIGSNMTEMGTSQPPAWIAPYRIVNKGELKIGLIGVTASYPDFYRLLGWNVSDPFEAVAKWARYLREQVDILVVISHLGLANDERLANEVEGIDCIMGGHTHHLLEHPLIVGNTAICAAGKFGRFVGKIEINYDLSERKRIGIDAGVIDVSAFPEDTTILKLIESYKTSSLEKLSQPIINLQHPVTNDWYKESQLGNLLASGLKRWTDAEIGLVNAGQILDSLKSGVITRELLLRICPHPINPCCALLSGENLWKAIEEALLTDFTHKPIRGFGFRGEVLGTLCLAGMTVTYDSKRLPYEKVLSILVNDEPLERSREYRVGMIDMFTFGVGYKSLQAGRELQYYLPEFLRDILISQLVDGNEIAQSKTPRWFEVSTGDQ